MSLHRHAYNLVMQKHGNFLYQQLKNCIVEHLNAVAEKVAQARDDLLLVLNEKWQEHQVTMRMIRDIFMYMVCTNQHTLTDRPP